MILSDVPYFERRVSFEWINESFQLFMRDIGTWILADLIYVVFSSLLSWLAGLVVSTLGLPYIVTPPGGSSIFNPFAIYGPGYWASLGATRIVSWPFESFFGAGFFKMANKSVRGESVVVGDVFSGGKTTLAFMGFGLLFPLLTSVGVVCCIVGAFVVMGLLFPTYALLADGIGLSDAIKRSLNNMKLDWLNAATFALVFTLLCCFTGLCCLPLLATAPMAAIVASLAYRDMIGMPIGRTVIQTPAPVGSWPPAPTGFSAGGFEPSQTATEPPQTEEQLEKPTAPQREPGEPGDSEY